MAIDNKKIAKNTVFLYIRMLFVMCVSLYTSREFLHLLGVVDYGLYNVVGSVVGMFSFIKGTLATSSQRFFSVELARNDIENVKKWFSLNVTVYIFFIVLIIFIAETIGLWFVNNKMIVPEERIFAANIVYQLSIVSCVLTLITVPYDALLISHERMGTFAFIGILDAILKLCMVYILYISSFDHLILYALMILFVQVLNTSMYMIYCRSNFPESRYKPYFNQSEFISLFSFSGWHFLGTISSVVRSQGVNLLINTFFSPAINAARAIAFQVNQAVSQFSNNFTIAVKPQLYKTYSRGEMDALYNLISRSSILSIYLSAILMMPLILNTDYVLSLWLREVPSYAVIFTQLVLINGVLESTNTSAIVPALATGKIKKFEIVISVLGILNLPVSYLALRLGAEPFATSIVIILLTIITIIWRAFLLHELIKLPHFEYLIQHSKAFLILILCYVTFSSFFNSAICLTEFLIESIIEVIAITILFYFAVLKKSERQIINKYVLKIINKKR